MTVPYSGGNGQSYGSWSTSSTGVTGLTAQLQSGTLANGSGNLTFDVFGTASSSGTAYFTINFGGVSCTVTKSVAGGTTPPPNPPVVIPSFVGKLCAYNSTTIMFGVVGNQAFPSVITSPDGTATLSFNHYQTSGTGLCQPATGIAQYNINGNIFAFDGMVLSDGMEIIID